MTTMAAACQDSRSLLDRPRGPQPAAARLRRQQRLAHVRVLPARADLRRLTALPPDVLHVAGGRGGCVAPEVALDDPQREVDARREPAGGGDPLVLDEAPVADESD